MEVLAFAATVIIGVMGSSIFGNLLNWPDAGAIFAIATMGVLILSHKKKRDE